MGNKTPKIISFFWGSSKLSWLRYMTLYSFRKFNPNWEMRLYAYDLNYKVEKRWESGHVQDHFMYDGKDYIDKVEELGVKVIPWDMIGCIAPSQESNFFKWIYLADTGGIYSDMDIIYIRPIDELYNKFVRMGGDVALTHNGSYFSIGFMMSSSNNIVFEEIYKNTVKYSNLKQYQGAGVIPIYKRWKNCQQMIKEFPDKVFYNIPSKYFYSLGFEDQNKLFNVDCFDSIKKDSFGIHWYAGAREAQEYNNWINEKNYKEKNCTVSKCLEYVLKD